MRLACARCLLDFSLQIRVVLREHAPAIRALRLDESPLLASNRAALRDSARYLIEQTPLRFVLEREARHAAERMARETAAAVGRRVPAQASSQGAFVESAMEKVDETLLGMLACSEAALMEWVADDELDLDDLDMLLDDCRDRHTGTLLGWLSMMFAWLTGRLTRDTQMAAGVTHAVWVDREDRRVRPAHHALHGTVFSWDGEPPLVADQATRGEACFPGDDFGCRCTAEPVIHPPPRVAGGVDAGRRA